MPKQHNNYRVWTIMCVLGVAASIASLRVVAQDAPSANAGAKNIAVANVARVFAEMQETKDLQTRMDAAGRKVMQDDAERSNKLKDLQSSRDLTRSNTPDWEKANKALMDARIEYRVWVETTRAEMAHDQKMQTKELYDKIIAAVGEIAKNRGIEIVVAEKKQLSPENIEKMNVDDFRAMLSQREVLYASAGSDITSEVIALLDARFKEGK